MGFLSKLIRGRVSLADLSLEISAAFLKNFAVDPTIRGETYNSTDLNETLEIMIFYISAISSAFLSFFLSSADTAKDGYLMHISTEVCVQFTKNTVEAMPHLKLSQMN